jgi:hypothetical protein
MSTFRAYLVTAPDRPREWLTVGAEAGKRARELGGEAQPYDLPATKAGLIPFLNSLEAELHASAEATAPASTPSPAPENEAAGDDDLLKLDGVLLEQQVEALGAAGIKGLEQLDHIQAFGGVGASFSRGVCLLNVIAAGEHQLARIFHRVNGKGRK